MCKGYTKRTNPNTGEDEYLVGSHVFKTEGEALQKLKEIESEIPEDDGGGFRM